MFKTFKVGELFDIHPTSAYKMKNDELFASDGTTPVLSNSSVNNGIGGYCGLTPTEQGGMITFSDTTTGADTMFYQSSPFIGYPHVQGMYPYQPNKWDEKCCLYVISCIRKSAGNGWNYAVKFNRALVKELSIELPVVESADVDHEYTVDDINYEYMQERVAELEQERVAELEQERVAELDAYLAASGLDDYELADEDRAILALSRKATPDKTGDHADAGGKREEEFLIRDMFTSANGNVDIQKTDINDCGIHVVSSGVSNCGIIGKTDREAAVFPANTITVDMFGYAFYRDFDYKMVTHARVFTLLPKKNISALSQIYIVTQLSSLPKMYNYSNMCSWNKIQNMPISLPIKIDSAGSPVLDPDCTYHPAGYIPNWDYMDKYIRAIEKLVIADVVKWKDEEIARTKEIVNKGT